MKIRNFFISMLICISLGACNSSNNKENPKEPDSPVVDNIDGVVSLEKTDIYLDIGETLLLTATITPSSSDESLIWDTSDDSVATIDSNGQLTAISEGKCTVTVKTNRSNSTATGKVTVRRERLEPPANTLLIPTIAHKGYHVTAIENTEEAFIEAGRRNFYGIETDIYLTKDGQWICNHDTYVHGMIKAISECTLEEIMKVNLSDDPLNPVRVCTFAQYIDVCKTYNKHPVIEFKMTPSQATLDTLCLVLETLDMIDECIFISFGQMVLEYMYDIKEENGYLYDIQLLTSDNKWQNVPANLNVSSQFSAINESMVEICEAKGQYVAAWTVNDMNTAKQLIKCGVRYITTDLFECDDVFVPEHLFN